METATSPATRSDALRDPVCGMTTRPDGAHLLVVDGALLAFCSARCKARFAAEPGAFAQPAPVTAPVEPEGERPLGDPVCGMKAKIDGAHLVEHEGALRSFCGGGCKTKFLADPA